MNNRNCTFKFSVEETGNWVEKEGKGICRSEAILKKTGKGDFLVCLVEGTDGQMYEVFANTIKFI